MLFACRKVQHVSFRSWELFGPGAVTIIDVSATAWAGYVRRIAANPFQRLTGTLLQIKMVYLGCLIEAYADTKLFTELESNRNDQGYNKDGKTIMRWYKEKCRKRYNGDAAIAMERSRNRAQNYYEKSNTRGFFPMPNFKMWLSRNVGDLFYAKFQNAAFYV